MTFLKPTKHTLAANLPEGISTLQTLIYDKYNDVNGNGIIKARFFIIEMENGKPELIDYTYTIIGLTGARKLQDKHSSTVIYYKAQFNHIKILENEINQVLKDLGTTKEVRLSIK
jgi:hypothetical protein